MEEFLPRNEQFNQHRRSRLGKMFNESLSMNFYQTNQRREQTTSGLNGQFVHSQLLIDCLLRMPPPPTDKPDFVNLCLHEHHNDLKSLEIVHELEETYASDRSIWWYTRETFIYHLLNKSLRIQNIDGLFQLRFLIRDIAEQLIRHRSMKCMDHHIVLCGCI